MKWLEVSLTVEQELIEPIAELLARFAAHGVATQVDPSNKITICGWIEHDHQLLQHKQALEEGLWHLSQINPLPDPSYREVDEDWIEVWKSKYLPLEIGDRFVIVPTWMEAPTVERQVVYIEPGIAFGSGAHPTTRMCLEFLENVLHSGDRVLDLGCGSGILAIAAASLDAASVLALDTDQQAVATAVSNIAQNGVEDIVQAKLGSLGEALPTGPFNLVLANILSHVLLDMLQAELPKLVAPDGHLILSGILENQVDPILARAQKRGLMISEVRSHADWRTLLLKQKTAA